MSRAVTSACAALWQMSRSLPNGMSLIHWSEAGFVSERPPFMSRSGKNSYGRRSQTLGFCPVAQRLTIRLVGRDVVARHYAMFVRRAHHERRRGMETKGLLDHRLQVLHLREVGSCNSSVQANDVIDFCLQLGKDWRSGECAPLSIRLWCSPLNVSQAIALTFFSEMNSSPSISWWLRSASTVSTSRCESPSNSSRSLVLSIFQAQEKRRLSRTCRRSSIAMASTFG